MRLSVESRMHSINATHPKREIRGSAAEIPAVYLLALTQVRSESSRVGPCSPWNETCAS